MLRSKNSSTFAPNPPILPPGEKTTDAYNTFWRDGYWFKVPMTSLHTSQVVDPPDGRLPPLTPAAREQRNRADELLTIVRLPVRKTGRFRAGAFGVQGLGPAFTGSGPGGQESTLEIIQSPRRWSFVWKPGRSQLIYLDGRPRPPASVHLRTRVPRAGTGTATRSSLNTRISRG